MSHAQVKLYQTVEHPCGYYAERRAVNLVIDPQARAQQRLYDLAIQQGFRRSGTLSYRPQCPGCRACRSSRIPVALFDASRAQRRCLERNADLELRVSKPERLGWEHHALFKRYVRSRHAGGGMDTDSDSDLERFLLGGWSNTHLLEVFLGKELVAVAVSDVLDRGLSAVYTFFDPDFPGRSLGTYAILQQIALARRLELPYLYLGYWIDGHPRMHYKTRFRPIEVLEDGEWRPWAG